MCKIIEAGKNQIVRTRDREYRVIDVTDKEVITELILANGEKCSYIFNRSVYESLITFSDEFVLD